MIFWMFLALLLGPQTVKPKKAYIIALPLEKESDPRTYLSTVDQVEIDRDLLYVRPKNSAEILVFDRERKFLFNIGGRGGGPGFFRTVISGFAVAEGHVWAFEHDTKMSYFQGAKHIRDIPIKGLQVSIHGSSTAAFAVDENLVLISAHPKTRKLGVAYAYDGTVIQGVGEIFPINRDVLLRNPATNDVLWVKGEGHWYAVFEYHPLVQVFDDQFQLVREIPFDTQVVSEFQDRWQDWQPKKGWRIPFELNRDTKYHDGHLWILCYGALLKLDPKTGALTGAWHFFGQRSDFKSLGRLHFYAFDFFSDGQLVLTTTADGWGSHLFTATL